jgi:hypothetical protein
MFLRISICLTGLVLAGAAIYGVLYLKKSNINSTGVEEGNKALIKDSIPVDGLQAFLSSGKEIYNLGESIDMTFRLKNVGETDLSLAWISGLLIDDKKLVNYPEVMMVVGNHIAITMDTFIICAFSEMLGENSFILREGDTHQENLIYLHKKDLSEDKQFFQITSPGTYYITARYVLPPEGKTDESVKSPLIKSWTGEVISNTIKITVQQPVEQGGQK